MVRPPQCTLTFQTHYTHILWDIICFFFSNVKLILPAHILFGIHLTKVTTSTFLCVVYVVAWFFPAHEIYNHITFVYYWWWCWWRWVSGSKMQHIPKWFLGVLTFWQHSPLTNGEQWTPYNNSRSFVTLALLKITFLSALLPSDLSALNSYMAWKDLNFNSLSLSHTHSHPHVCVCFVRKWLEVIDSIGLNRNLLYSR